MLARQTVLNWTDEKFESAPFFTVPVSPFLVIPYGALLDDDCMNILPLIKDEVVDTIVADPPFRTRSQVVSKARQSSYRSRDLRPRRIPSVTE
ncbi:MAG: hypothetical protein OXC19_09635 [Bryobacterales bacterium]|nr:hypothetical protein [Bryobacterales bacterium]